MVSSILPDLSLAPTAASRNSPSPPRGRGVGERGILLTRAKTMRGNQTDAEQRLWYYLRAQRFMGLKFKRQKPIGPYIADFVCMELHLVIEADGGQHGGARDLKRDHWFQNQGYTMLHFWDNDVLAQTEAVLEQVREAVLALSPAPLPQAGEGSQKPWSGSLVRREGEGGMNEFAPTKVLGEP